MKRLLAVLIASVIVSVAFAESENNDFYFYDKQDCENIANAARTEWGSKIIENLKEVVRERRSHPMEVPTLEGGHIHYYFCPIHNLMFEFDWDSPEAHYCKACGKKWDNNPVYNWAWVNTVHTKNMDYMLACMYIYLATNDTLYSGYIRDMMLDYASKYPAYKEHSTDRNKANNDAAKMFGQCLDEAVWASDVAKAYHVIKPTLTDEQVKYIEDNYLRPCANMLMSRKHKLNWQTWLNSAIAALGVALEDDKVIDKAINDPVYGFRTLLAQDVYDDGWWKEGSPIYHFYPLRSIILTAEAVRCRGINLYDKKLYNMLASPVYATYSDLSFPAHNDGWYGENLIAQVKLYELGYARYKDPLFLDVLTRCYNVEERSNPEALVNGCELNTTKKIGNGESYIFNDAGFALLKYKDKTAVLKYGPHGGIHGHPDKLSISLHNGVKEVISDLGTSAYGVPDYMEWYRKTLAHNTVVVDGQDQEADTGSVIEFSPDKNGVVISASSDKAYSGVHMQRTLRLNKNKLEEEFICNSDNEHQYEYVLLFNDKPEIGIEGVDFELGQNYAYKKIKNTKLFKPGKNFKVNAGNSVIEIEVMTEGDVEVICGEAPGIPPTNPGVVTKTGTEKRPVMTCYPLIIRTKGCNMHVASDWRL